MILQARPAAATGAAAQQIKYLEGQLAAAREQLRVPGPGVSATVAALTIENYRPRSTGPKSQLTGTDVSAYAPWKWAVNEKLRVNEIIYPIEEDRVSYGFSQLTQPIFQQLDL